MANIRIRLTLGDLNPETHYLFQDKGQWVLMNRFGDQLEFRKITNEPVLLGFALQDAAANSDNPAGQALAVAKLFCPGWRVNLVHTVTKPPELPPERERQPVPIPAGLLGPFLAAVETEELPPPEAA